MIAAEKEDLQYQAAKDTLLEALERSPESSPLHLQHAQLLLKRGDLEESYGAFYKSLIIEPNNSNALAGREQVLKKARWERDGAEVKVRPSSR